MLEKMPARWRERSTAMSKGPSSVPTAHTAAVLLPRGHKVSASSQGSCVGRAARKTASARPRQPEKRREQNEAFPPLKVTRRAYEVGGRRSDGPRWEIAVITDGV